MKKIWLAYTYLQYLFHSKSRYVIHSPFVYDFVTNAIKDEQDYPECKMPDRTFQKYKKRIDRIETIDFGVKSGKSDFITKQTTVGKIVRQRSHTIGQLHLLFRLSKYFQPETILELGTAAGISALYLASGSPKSKIYTLEGCVGLSEIAKKCFYKRRLNNIEVIPGNFDTTLKKLLTQINKLDLVFFDGNHREKPTLNYFEQCLPLATENSVFIFDDIHWSSDMEKAWAKIKENEQVTVTIDLYWAGLVFFRKGQAKEHFIIRY